MDTVNVVVGDTTLNMATHVTEDIALGVGDNFLTFLDENSSVVFKGVIDPNGTFLIDPSQFVNILLDQSQSHGQSFLDTSNPLTIQMVQPPPGVSLGGKSMMNENVSYSTTGKLGHLKSFQIQNHATPSDVLSAKCYGSTQLTSANAQDSVSPVAIPRFLTPTTAPGLTEIFVQKTPKRNDALIKITDTVAELREENSDMLARETSFICNVCSEVFSGYQQLRKHKATHVDEKPFRCSQCNMEFNFEINLKLHSIIHEAEESGNLHCKVCLAKFSRLASLKSHLRTHEKEENLVCNECGEEVPTLAKLNDHMEEHNTRVQQCMVYRCKLCGKTFNSQALLRDHSKGHAEVRKELKIFARQKPRSKSRQKLASESASWTPNKSKKKRVCSVCSKAFDKPSQLERHFRVHSGAKPFQCSYPDCNKCFNQKVTLESHVLACHQRLKPFKCHMCNICFSQRGNLKSHIIKVHIPSGENDKVFKCEECACVYRRLATLNHHIARVHSVVSKEEFPSLPSNPETDQSAPDSTSRKLVEPTPCPSATVETPVTNKPETDQVEEPSLVSDEATTSEVSTNKAPDQLTETIHEVNCIYADSVGVPRRCLLKVKKVGQKKYHLCPACPKSFRKPSDLIRHIRVHTLERPYVCNICTKSFAVKSTLSTHLKTHDLIKRLSCSVCQKKFSTLSSLKSHERLHTGAKPFQCMQCGKQFRTSTQRRVHQKTHTRNALGLTGRRKLLRIGDVKPSIRLPDPLKITSGGLVPVPNRIVRTTVNGLPIDQTSRPYRCTHADCTSSFKKSSHLKQHALSHSGERPYKCLQCHRNFISSGVLKNHIKTHEGVRAYSCDQCHFAFTTNGSLKRHMATHLDERLFVCPYCARTFKTSVATRKHIKVHRNETVPPNSSFHDLGKQPKGIMLINQNSASEYPQQFSDVQIYDASELTNIYGSEFNDMSQVLANQLNLEVSRQEGEDRSIGSNPTPELHVPATENVLEESTVIACHDSVVLHHPGRDSILEYTLLASTISSQEDTTENLDLPLDQEPNFDPSIFTLQLQQGESLDLQFLQDSQGIGNDSTCLNQIVSYEFETPSVEHLSESENVSENECALQDKKETIRPTPLATTSPPSCTKKKKSSTVTKHKAPNINNAEDSVEVRNLQEVSRPISEQLYTELATQPYQRRLKTEMRPGNLDETVGNKDCPICGTKFKKKSDLDRHYLIHTGEKPYRCSICGKSFRVKSTRQAHMRTHDEKKKTVACHVCQNLFSTKSSLRVHLRSHLNLKPYPCPFPNCTRQFRTSGHRKSHIQSHFKQAKKRKIDGGNGFSKTKGSLPSVQTIKDHQNSSSTIDKQIEQLEQRVQTMLETSTMEVPDSNAHLVGGAQLQFDGVQFTNLDMSSLQVDDSFLQNVTNVIFLPSGNQGGEVVDGTNVIIGMLPGQELPPSSELPYNILGSGIQLTADQLDNGAVTLSDNIHQYIIHNNEMMSSTARPNTGGNEGQNYILPSASQEFLCSTCHVPFQSKIKLDKHEKTHALVPKPFKCSICPRSFVQKGSFEVHFKMHSKEKVEFACPLCPYLTQRKPNLKTHFSRAHPNNMEQFNQVIGSISKVGKS